MKEFTFRQKINNTINNGKTTIEELKAIEPILIENCKSSIRSMYTYYFVTVVITVIWFLIYNSVVNEVKVMDITINNRTILLFAIPFVSISAYYITMSYLAFNQLIDVGLKQIQKEIYPNISAGSMMELLIYPSIIELESIKMRISKESFLNTMAFLAVISGFVFIPIIFNGIICYCLIVDYYGSELIILPILYFLILYKITKNFIFYLKQSQ